MLLAGLPFLVVGALLALAGARLLNTLALGDDLARGLGRRTDARPARRRRSPSSCSPAPPPPLAGPIAFVGLVVPARRAQPCVGPDHAPRAAASRCSPAPSWWCVADTVGRVVLPPSEVQVGIMAAAVGVPVFIALIRRAGRAL